MWRKLTGRTQRRRHLNERDPLQRFTDHARTAVTFAQHEARQLGHDYLGTEHLLLGLLRERSGVAARALVSLGVSLDAARARVEQIVGRCASVPRGYLPLAPRMKKVLVELSLAEALRLGHNYVGTEHLLLALLREGQGVGAQVLAELGVDLTQASEKVTQLLTDYHGQPDCADSAPTADEAALLDVLADNERLRQETERLRELLRRHGIQTEGGTSQTA